IVGLCLGHCAVSRCLIRLFLSCALPRLPRSTLFPYTTLFRSAGDLQGGLRGALAVAGLQHEQLAVLDGELHILHDAVVALQTVGDRKSTRLNSSHVSISYAAFCLK